MNQDERANLIERFEREVTEGYLDGRKPDNPTPSANRSASYCHGFANGRDDYARSPRATAALLRLMAAGAIQYDIETTTGKSLAAPLICKDSGFE